MSSFFRNGSVHEFYRLKASILLWNNWLRYFSGWKQEQSFEQNFDCETNWSGIVNFHCMQKKSCDEHAVYIIFGDDWNDALSSSGFLEFRLFTHVL